MMNEVKDTPESLLYPIETLKLKAWRSANGLMAAFLILCTILQHNDPDPELWMPLYGTGSLLCLSVATSPYYQVHIMWRIMCGIEITCCLALSSYTIMYMTEETWSIKHGHNPLLYEEGRELLGILIVVLWLTVCLFYTPERLNISSSRQQETAIIFLICSAAIFPMIMWGICMVGTFSENISYCKFMCSGTG